MAGISGMLISALLVWPATAMTSSAALLVQDSGSLKERPVMKVVRLLQDMAAELQNELDVDRQVHEQLTCWCKTNDKEKTKAIELGKASSAHLEASISEFGGKVAELKQKRKGVLDEVHADQKSLGKATALRMKANQAFHKEEAGLIEAVAATKQAVTVLGEHNPQLAQLRSAARRLHSAQVPQLARAAAGLRREQLEVLWGFLRQAPQASFLALPRMQSFAPQSGQIFGILQQMQQDFEHSLAQSQEAEKKDAATFEVLKAAKQEEITVGQKSLVDHDAALADFGQKSAQAQKQLQDTQEQLALDRTFLENLEAQCSKSHVEFDARVKSRLDEISAVQDAIQLLSSGESFKAFSSASSFLQTGASSTVHQQEQQLRQQTSALLSRAAAHTGATKLAMLAISAKLDTFTQVNAAIGKLMEELAAQQKDEVAHRDWCVDELAANKRATAAAEDKKAGLQTKAADLGKTIEKLASDVAANTASVAELQLQMKRASETREAENADFQQTIIDQHLTHEILTKALKRLKQVYAFVQQSKRSAPHIEVSGDATNPGNGPASFTKYEHNAGGFKAVMLIEEIITDSATTAAQVLQSEQDSQAAYETFMKDSNKSITAQSKSISDQIGSKSQAEESLFMVKTDAKQTVLELENLSITVQDVHKSCDFITKNFAARQAARSAEMEALGQAKGILSGMK